MHMPSDPYPPTPPCPPTRPQGEVLLVRQIDQPGIIASVSSELAAAEVNISFMTVARQVKGVEAIMAIGVDSTPSAEVSQSHEGEGGRAGVQGPPCMSRLESPAHQAGE